MRSPLTPRQEQVLHMAAAGYTTRQIADRLVLSHETIRYHLKCGYRNLGVHTRADAVAALARLQTHCVTCARPLEEAE